MKSGNGFAWIRFASPLVDLMLVNLAFLGAYWMRYVLGLGGTVEERFLIGLEDYREVQVGLSVVLLAVYAVAGVYRDQVRPSLVADSWRVLAATSVGMMLLLAFVFLFQGYGYSRGLFAFAWLLVSVFTVAARVVARLLSPLWRRWGIGVRRVVVVGGGGLGYLVMHVLTTEPGLGYELVGFVSDDEEEDVGRFPRLASISELAGLVQEHRVDEVIVALPAGSPRPITDIMEQCHRNGLGFRVVPDLYELSLSRVDIEDLRGIPLVGVKPVSLGKLDYFLKRAFDLAIALALVIILAPLLALIAIAIKLDSSGPVLFRQIRLGRGDKPFPSYKFRSMKDNAEAEVGKLKKHNEATWPLFKMRNDPRITRVGRLLRRTSLDELPQFFNVIKGEMSLVGPRPPIPSEVETYKPWHRRRLEVAPGVTGLWQVSGRSDLPFDEMVMLDIYYIENWSLALDFSILLRTIPAVLSGRGAY